MSITPIPVLMILQLIPFLLTLFALYHIIFKPMLEYLDERHTSTDGARAKAEELNTKASEQLIELENKLIAAKKSIGTKRAAARAECMVEYNVVISSARKNAEVEVNAAVAEIHKQQEAASAELKSNANQIANQIASQALGRQIALG
jgi:F0F1-type ATP synthase membrane subunit b/b'